MAVRQTIRDRGVPGAAAMTLSVRLITLLPAAALVMVPARVQAQMAAATPAPGPKEGRHVFWRLDKPGGGQLFLLGSLHFGDERLYPLPATVEQAYQSCDRVVFETDLRLTRQPEFAEMMRRKAEWVAPTTLGDALAPDALAALRATARGLGVEPAWLERYRAWYCANQLMSIALRRAGVDPLRGIDQVFCTRTLADGKSTEALETPEFQVDLFAALADGQAAALLTESLAEVSQVREFVERMLNAYLDGDLGALEQLIAASFDGVPDLQRRFLTDRNAAWMAPLQACSRRPGTDLVIVGTGHLLGTHGLVERLRRAGFAVTRL